jgi:hypothetical protein
MNMKKIFTLIVVLFVGLLTTSVAAKTWTNGNATGIWSDAANWDPVGVPTSGDRVYFDGDSSDDDCLIDVSISVRKLMLNWNYNGVVTQGVNKSIYVNASAISSDYFRVRSGSFIGSNAAITVDGGTYAYNGAVRIDGGVFQSTSGVLKIRGGDTGRNLYMFYHKGGTFDPNGGTVEIEPYNSYCCHPLLVIVQTTTEFYNLKFDMNRTHNAGSAYIGITNTASSPFTSSWTEGSCRVINEFYAEDGGFSGTVKLFGDLVIGTEADARNGKIEFLGNADQTWDYLGGPRNFGGIIVNKTAGSKVEPAPGELHLYTTTFELKSGDFYAGSGTFITRGTGGGEALIFKHTGGNFYHGNGTFRVIGSWTGQNNKELYVLSSTRFNHVRLENNSTQNRYVNVVNAELRAEGNLILENGRFGGSIGVEGNVTVRNTADGGNLSLRFRGGNNQTYLDEGGNEPDGDVYIIKSAGTVTLLSHAQWSAANQDLILHASNSGTLSQGAYGIWTKKWYHNAGTFDGGTGYIKVDYFRQNGGIFNSTTGTFECGLLQNNVTTDVFEYNNGIFNAGTGSVYFNSGAGWTGTYHTIIVNQPLSLNNVSFRMNNNYSSRQGFKLTGSGNITADGDITFKDGTVQGNPLYLLGNLIIEDLATQYGYYDQTGTVVFTGAANQTYQTIGSGQACSITIDKPGGSVTPAPGTTSLVIAKFKLLSGSFTAPSGQMTMNIIQYFTGDDFKITSGTSFFHNGGKLTISGLVSGTGYSGKKVEIEVADGVEFNKLDLISNPSGYPGDGNRIGYELNSGGILKVAGDFRLINGFLTQTNGEMHLEGDVYFDANANTGRGNSSILFTGSNDQEYTDVANNAPTGQVEINKTGGTVTLLSDANWANAGQNLTFTASNTGALENGAYILNTNNLTIESGTLDGGTGAIIADKLKVHTAGTVNLPDAEITLGQDVLGAGLYDVLDISGTVTHSGSGQVTLSGTRNANIKVSSGNLNLNYLKIDKGTSSVYLVNGDLTVHDELELVGDPSFYVADHAITTKDLTLNGTMYFEDNGSLVQTSGGVLSGTGEIDYQRRGLNYQAGFNLWSSPIVQADLFGVFANSNQCVLYGFDQGQQLWRFDLQPGQALGCAGFPTMNTTWSMGGSSGYSVDGKMDIGLGYAATGSTLPNDDIRTFVGKPNNGVISVPVRATNITTTVWDLSDWNLLGNPYPCGLSMSGFWQENAVNNTRIEGGLYFMVDPGPGNPQYHQYNDFAVYNGIGFLPPLNSPGLTHNGFIGAGQGFWVDAVGAAGTVSNVEFNNSMRSGTNDKFYKRGNNLSNPDGKVYLSISHSSFTSNQVLIGTKFDATMGRDAQYDAEQGYEGVMPPVALMTMIGRKGYVIQGIPPIDPDTYREIPLYVHTIYDGLHTFEVNNMEKFSGYTMYIEDRVKGTQTEINPGTGHSVRMMKGDYPNRFYLVIEHGKSSNTTIKNIADEIHQSGLSVTPIGGGVVTYQQGEKLVIDALASESEISTVDIFDVVGRRVYSSTGLGQKLLEIEKNGWTEGIYVISLGLTDGTNISEKVALVQ